MDLKEIFGHDERMVHRHGADVHRSYGKLKERFDAFQKCLREPFRAGFPQGAFVFLDAPDGDHYFRISFCGRELLFCFDMVEGGSYEGRVTCIAQSTHQQFEPSVLGHFAFNTQGFMEFDPDGRGAMKIDDQDAATAILVSFMTAAVAIENRSLVARRR